jgi:AcrR family transcriptional regulator
VARTGRRPGNPATREAILNAARAEFAQRGFDRTTVRVVAGAADVDPALIHHYFGTKEALFVAALELPFEPADVIPKIFAAGPERAGEELVGLVVRLWDATSDRSPLLAMIRTASSSEAGATMLREFFTRTLLGRIGVHLDGDPQTALRTNLVASQMVGLAIIRYVVRVEPLASADVETVVAAVGPTVQRYLTGPLEA